MKRKHYIKTKAAFGCVKAFPENILFSENVIFRKGKCIQVFGCARNSFYGNEILVFVSGIRFTEMRFTENHFQRLFPENEIHFFTENHFSCLVCAALPK